MQMDDQYHTTPVAIIVEDDPFWMKTIIAALADEDVEILQAGSAKKGLELLAQNRSAILIVDIILPDMDGLEFMKAAQKLVKGVPVMAISAGGRLGADFYLRLASGFGALETLKKPFTRDRFLQRWRRLVTS